MARYIDADALNSAIEEWFDGICVYDVSPSEAVNDFQSIIDEQPTISPDDLRPVGKWIPLEPEIGLYGCSRCEHMILRAECNYCPNCGAAMSKGE